MVSFLFVLAFLLYTDFSLCSSTRYREIYPTALQPLKIDDKKIGTSRFRPRPIVYFSEGTRDFDQNVLRAFYQMAENDEISEFVQSIYDVGSCSMEIFEMNKFYSYTPAEWALHNNKMRVFQLFVSRRLGALQGESREELIGTRLMAMAIQYHNLDAVKIIVNYADFDYSGKGFLSIAAQHNASQELFGFLLDNCRLGREINQQSADGNYPKPLVSCAKFNNSRAAVLLLQRGASFGGGKSIAERDESFLAHVFKRNKTRMLETILTGIPYLRAYKDSQGNSLFHYAAIYSRDPKMIQLIHGNCPNLSVDSQNKHQITPLLSLLTSGNAKMVEVLAVEFISLGANPMIISNDLTRPLDLIIRNGHFIIFKSIIAGFPLNFYRTGILKKMAEGVSKYSLWTWLDVLLEVLPQIDVDWIDFSTVTFDELLREGASLSFEKALLKNALIVPPNCLQQIAHSGDKKFLMTALKNGFNITSINVSKMLCLDETDADMIQFIRRLQREHKDMITLNK